MKKAWHIKVELIFSIIAFLCCTSVIWGTNHLNNQTAQRTVASRVVISSREQEIPVPANGNCLYSALVMGYLLPVADDAGLFNLRLAMLVGEENIMTTEETKNDKEDENNDDKKAAEDNLWDASELRQQFLNLHKRTFVYTLRHQPFSTLVTDFRRHMGMGNTLWGGPQEIQTIANKLQVTIEEYTPNPDDNNKSLTQLVCVQPKQKKALLALRIVRDNPTNEEGIDTSQPWNVQMAQQASVKNAQNRQHYRALPTSIPSFLLKKGNCPPLPSREENVININEKVQKPQKKRKQDQSTQSQQIAKKLQLEHPNNRSEQSNLLENIELLREKRGHFDGENAQDALKAVAHALQQIGQLHQNEQAIIPTDQAFLTRKRKIDKLIKKYAKKKQDDIMVIIILNALKTCGDLATATTFYENAMERGVLLIKDSKNLKTKESKLDNLARCFYYLRKYGQALAFYNQALKIRKNKLGENDPSYANTFHNIAAVYERQGQYREAIKYYNLALKVEENTLSKQHPTGYATTLHNIALVYSHQGQYELAMTHYNLALDIRKNILGDKHPSYATTLNNIASVYDHQGQYDNAIKTYKQALEIRKNILGDKHPSYATTLNNIALVYENQGQYDNAIKTYKQVLKIQENTLGDKHPSYATTLNNIASVYDHQGQYDNAIKTYKQALKIKENTLGDKHPSYATTLHNIALVYSHQGQYELAMTHYNLALDIRKNILGDKHPSYATTLNNIASVYDHQGQYDNAIKTYKQALEIRKNILGDKHPSYATTLNNIALVYENQGQYDNAIKTYKQVLKIKENTLGDKHPSYATTLNNIASVYDHQGQYDNAIKTYKQALKIKENTLGDKHPSYATTLNNIASVYDHQGQYDNAMTHYNLALDIYKNTLGKAHPHYKVVVKNIEVCQLAKQNSQTPSHNELMQKLAQCLQVPYKEVYSGIAVAAALVSQASIARQQEGAFFRRVQGSVNTYFELRLQGNEYDQFIKYYQKTYPNLIKAHKRINTTWVNITFDTCMLYEQVAPALKPSSINKWLIGGSVLVASAAGLVFKAFKK